MIGKEWNRPRKVVVLVLDADGVQHGFEIDRPSRAAWQLLDTVNADGRSTGRVTVEGAMYRMSVDPTEAMPSLRPVRQEVPGQMELGS